MRYTIEGTPLPAVICSLEAGETMITEKGAMSWMSANMQMQTNMNGGFGKALGRAFSGESMFMNIYTCIGGPGIIAFASSFPGSIMPIEISAANTIIAQKSAFLAAESTVQLSVHFNRKFGAGLFGGEGFIMQKLTGNGFAFLEIDGHLIEYTLAPGQTLYIDTGHLAAMTDTVSLDIEAVKGVKNMLFGGEGIFNTKVTGPGKVWIQTMPASKMAGAIRPFIPLK